VVCWASVWGHLVELSVRWDLNYYWRRRRARRIEVHSKHSEKCASSTLFGLGMPLVVHGCKRALFIGMWALSFRSTSSVISRCVPRYPRPAQLQSQVQMHMLIEHSFIPPAFLERIRARCVFDEDAGEYVIRPPVPERVASVQHALLPFMTHSFWPSLPSPPPTSHSSHQVSFPSTGRLSSIPLYFRC